MWGGKNLDLGTKPGGRRDEVSVKIRNSQRFTDDITRADVRVLARYSGTGLFNLVKAIGIGVLVATVGIGVVIAGAFKGELPDGFGLVIAIAVIVGYGRVLISAIRGMANVVNHGKRALYVEDGRLIYVAPGVGGGFSATAAEIQSVEFNPKIDKFGPGIIVKTTKPFGANRRISVASLDVEPQLIIRQIQDFAGPKTPGAVS